MLEKNLERCKIVASRWANQGWRPSEIYKQLAIHLKQVGIDVKRSLNLEKELVIIVNQATK